VRCTLPPMPPGCTTYAWSRIAPAGRMVTRVVASAWRAARVCWVVSVVVG
jgi:hypothetical protein